MKVVFVLSQMFGEVTDALCQKRDLHLRGSNIALVGLKISDRLLFRLFRYGHSLSPTIVKHWCSVIGVWP